MADAKGIKEILEFLEGLKVLRLLLKKVLEDGKVGIDDLVHLQLLIEKYQVLVEAIKGASEIPAEAKDLSMEEIEQIIAKLLEVAKGE